MIIEHQVKVSAYQLACGAIERCILKQYAHHEDTAITLWLEHGVYHVRAHDHELHGRLSWDSFNTLTSARKRFAELKRNLNSAMKKQLFNLTGE